MASIRAIEKGVVVVDNGQPWRGEGVQLQAREFLREIFTRTLTPSLTGVGTNWG